MNTDTQTFINEKLDNLIIWASPIIGEGHSFIEHLRKCRLDPSVFYNYVSSLEHFASKNNTVEPNLLDLLLQQQNIKLNAYQLERLNKYLCCFITIKRGGSGV